MNGVRLKVTNNPKDFNWGSVLPCQIGFKQKDNSYLNKWVDVIVTNKTSINIPVSKGDIIKVTGNLHIELYNGDEKWKIFAHLVEPFERQPQRGLQQMDDTLF